MYLPVDNTCPSSKTPIEYSDALFKLAVCSRRESMFSRTLSRSIEYQNRTEQWKTFIVHGSKMPCGVSAQKRILKKLYNDQMRTVHVERCNKNKKPRSSNGIVHTRRNCLEILEFCAGVVFSYQRKSQKASPCYIPHPTTSYSMVRR